jgi:ribonuclease HI
MEFMGETLAYAPHKAIKSQILTDFVAEWADTQLPPLQIQAECWTLYFDRSVMKMGAGAGLLFISPLGEHMRYVIRMHFPASNNMAEYEALLCGLRIATEIGIKCLDVRGDSQLMIDQVMKNASCHNDKMEAYCNAMRALEHKFYGIELNHVPRRYNEEVDELAKIASGRVTVPPNVFARDVAKPYVNLGPSPSSQVEPLGAPSNPAGTEPMDEDPSNEAFVLSLLEGYGADEAEAMEIKPAPCTEDWRAKYLAWMDRGELPPDRSEARHIASMAKSFTVVDGEFTSALRPASYSGASPSPKVASSSETSMRACVATTRCRVPSWATHSARAFTGPPRSLTPMRSYAPARGASSMPVRLISRLTPFKRFPSHGLSPCGGWTSSSPCERRPGATLTCWSLWISSPNGSRHTQSQTSGRSKLCLSLLTSSTGSKYRIPSSPTMGPNLPAGSSWIFATNTTSEWIGRSLHIQRPMVRWSVPTA